MRLLGGGTLQQFRMTRADDSSPQCRPKARRLASAHHNEECVGLRLQRITPPRANLDSAVNYSPNSPARN
jgi:hypothetical protein